VPMSTPRSKSDSEGGLHGHHHHHHHRHHHGGSTGRPHRTPRHH
jgi:hypothetical protein